MHVCCWHARAVLRNSSCARGQRPRTVASLPSSPGSGHSFRATVSYDGADFYGMQRQPRPLARSRTVQGCLETALCRLLNLDAADPDFPRVTPAGRTDSGVHAQGQVVSFTAPRMPGTGGLASFRRGLNALLPPDVRVLDLRPVDQAFSARFDAIGKTYEYTIDNAPDACPLHRRFAAHVHVPLDVRSLRAAAASFVGTHDFTAFANVSVDPRDPVKLVTACDVAGEQGSNITITVTGSGFLYRQVRNMVGALLRVGTGVLSPDDVARLLAGGTRPDWLKAAPAHGLCLRRVFYADDQDAPLQLVEYARARDARWAADAADPDALDD